MKRITTLITVFVSAVAFGTDVFLQMENDALIQEDNDYSHGTMLEIIDDYKIHYKLQQNMYTPSDLKATEHIPGDRPYSGLLLGGVGYEFQNDMESPWTHYAELNFGMIGPASMCKETQSMIHKLLDCRKPKGWDNNQIHNEFVVNAEWWTRYNYYLCDYVALVPKAGVAVGTIEDFAELGGDIKVGYHLRHEYGNNIMFSQSANKQGSWLDKLSCYVFAGASEKYVLYNHMLEGSMFNHKDDDINVSIEPFVWEFRCGAVIQYDRFYAGYCAVFRGDEFKHQPNAPDYGMIRLGWTF